MKFWKIFVAVAAVLMIGAALYLTFSAPEGIFNTPDENANYFFTENFSFDHGLKVFASIEEGVDNALHPRGVNIIKNFLVPESFLGLPLLYGAIKTALGGEWMPVALVILLTLSALYALYQLFSGFFEQGVARLALLLVLALPVFVYWLGRPYMHTALFLDFLILGWWLLARGETKWHIISGILLGLALAVRTAEVVWVGVGTLVLLLPLRVRGSQRGLRAVHNPPQPSLILREGVSALKLAFGVALVLIPLLFLNQDLYGNFFGTGYSVSETNLVVEGAEVPQLAQVSLVKQLLLPFGFHPLEAAGRFVRYALGGMWWWVAPMVLGAIVGIMNYESRIKGRGYEIVWLLLAAYLVLAYGSFRAEVFADEAHPLAATIGAPYLRYWLPIFVFGAPLAAEFFLWLKHALSSKFYILHFTFYILLVFFSLRSVVWHGPESWRGIQDNLWNFAEARERAVRATPEDAVFMVPRWADRIYFPARKVIVDVDGKDVVGIINTLQEEGASVFWHRGRGEIKLEPELSPPARGGDEGVVGEKGFRLERRFDLDPKGKVYQIISNSPNF